MVNYRFILFLSVGFLFSFFARSQETVQDKTVTFETLYDDPYDLNKVYLHVQPMYGEFFMTNVNIGFGLEVDYYLNRKFDFNLNFRKAYSQRFDMMRDASEKNNSAGNTAKAFYYLEGGGTYHIVDKEETSKVKFVLYSKNYKKRNQWETMVPEFIEANLKRRRIYGVRLGGSSYQSSFDVNRVLENQGKTLTDNLGEPIVYDASFYSSISGAGFYVGGVMQLIRNAGIEIEDPYENNSSDLDFQVFVDVLVNPSLNVNDVYYRPDPESPETIIDLGTIDTNMIGGRAGIKGKFNRELSFGYIIETGIRPGLKGENFYMLAKLSFPIFGTKMVRKVDSFER